MALHELVIEQGLVDRRNALLTGIDPSVRAQIPRESRDTDQALCDIEVLSAVPPDRGGEAPIFTWLSNALRLTAGRNANRHLQAILDECRARVTDVRRGSVEAPQDAEWRDALELEQCATVLLGERAPRATEEATELWDITEELLSHAGVRELSRRDGAGGRPVFAGRLGDSPELLAFVPARTERDAAVALRSKFAGDPPQAIILLIPDRLAGFAPRTEPTRPVIVLGPIADKFGLCDLLVGLAGTLDGRPTLAGRPVENGIDLERVHGAVRRRAIESGSFEQRFRAENLEVFRFDALLDATRQSLERSLSALKEYRGAGLTVPREVVEKGFERLSIESSSRKRNAEAQPTLAVIGAQGVGKTSAVAVYCQHADVPALFVRARELNRVFRDHAWSLGTLLASTGGTCLFGKPA